MSVTYFETEEEFDDAFVDFEELQFEHLNLKQEVEDKRRELEYAEKALADFEEDNEGNLL
jgi:hypothetical protein